MQMIFRLVYAHPQRFKPFPSLTTKEEESVIYKNICLSRWRAAANSAELYSQETAESQ